MRSPRINNNYLQGIHKDMLNILEAHRDVAEINKRDPEQENVLLNYVTSKSNDASRKFIDDDFFNSIYKLVQCHKQLNK